VDESSSVVRINHAARLAESSRSWDISTSESHRLVLSAEHVESVIKSSEGEKAQEFPFVEGIRTGRGFVA